MQRNGSAWVTFSNRHYDPDIGAGLYLRYPDEMEYADQLGFDGVCVNERHQTVYGLMPIPGGLAESSRIFALKHPDLADRGAA